MPQYLATPPPPYSIGPGESVQVWGVDTVPDEVAAGTGGASASQQVALVRAWGERHIVLRRRIL